MFDVTTIVQHGGLLLLAVFLFAEVGLFLGFFLPGDTLLIAAGIYAKQGKMNLAAIIFVAALAAIAGDNVAYNIGRHFGRRLFKNKDSLIFDPNHIARAEAFYDRFGAKTLLVSHFLPIVRTFTPLLAGIAKMTYPKFATFNAVGDILWAVGVTLVGYYVGSRIPGVDKYIMLVIIAAVVLSAGPTLIHFAVRHFRHRRAAAKLD